MKKIKKIKKKADYDFVPINLWNLLSSLGIETEEEEAKRKKEFSK